MADVFVQSPHGKLNAYLARPSGDGPWPGVIVIHDIMGMTRDLHAQADWLPGAGFVAVAPDLFSWGWRPRCLIATMRDVAAGRGAAFDDVDQVKCWLTERDDCTGRV